MSSNHHIDLDNNKEDTIQIDKKLYEKFIKYQTTAEKHRHAVKKYYTSDKGRKRNRVYGKQYYRENKERLRQKAEDSRILCKSCDMMVRKKHFNYHSKTKYHLKRLEKYNEKNKKEPQNK